MADRQINVRCCIAGGGPAGMMLGLLLARAGVDVLVLEKHADFLRDFRGDTIHPSTLEVMHELGILDQLLALPHQPTPRLRAQVGDYEAVIADFTHLPTRCGYIAFMPQWDFLSFLAAQAQRWAGFKLEMRAEVAGLIEENGTVVGVRAQTPEGALEVRADLVVGADGRHSAVRDAAGMTVETFGAPMDVLWFRLSHGAADPTESMGRFDNGVIFVLINRGEHWQVGYVIPKGSLETLRARGIEAFRADVVRLAPFARERIGEIASWDDVKLLCVQVDRLAQWHRPGLLCIGDAAHAMSPVGGVGINLAIQDAVATANILAAALADARQAGPVDVALLARVQQRRDFPTRMTQRAQVLVQERVVRRVIGRTRSDGTLAPPLAVRLLNRFPILRRIPARLVGMGIRPEHVASPAEPPTRGEAAHPQTNA